MVSTPTFERDHVRTLGARLREPRRFIQVLAGARQVGKTTIALQALARLDRPHHYASADEPTLRDSAWLHSQWATARALAGAHPSGATLVIDEIQKVDDWAEAVKADWDADSRHAVRLHVVLLGSAPLLVQQGVQESLAGRFETIHVPHWTFGEMERAFGWSLEPFLAYGGYPGAAPLIDDPARWTRYLRDALIETTIARDVLLHTRVQKPALLRRLFELGALGSGQIIAYSKLLGQLHDAGNTTTLAHYLELLAGAGMLIGLQKYARTALRRRASSPKLQVFAPALTTALDARLPEVQLRDPVRRGRICESAVGAHLLAQAPNAPFEVGYWREGDAEVDFVVHGRGDPVAIEVKSGSAPRRPSGLSAFSKVEPDARPLIVGGDGVPLDVFLREPLERLLSD
jgi:predicted AAA+ superfamily ATPase